MPHRCTGSGGISDKEDQMSVAGTWMLKVKVPWAADVVEATAILRESGSTLKGRMKAYGRTFIIYEGKLVRPHASWKVDIEFPIVGTQTVEFDSTIDGDDRIMSGTVRVAGYTFEFTGQKVHSVVAGIRGFTRLLGLARS
jgi:hypothetical protein